CLLREWLDLAGAGQHRGERRGVVAERGQARRDATIGCLEALGEYETGLGRRGGKPSADQSRLAPEIGFVPKPAAEQLRSFRAGGHPLDLAGNLLETCAALRDEEGIKGRYERNRRIPGSGGARLGQQ